MNLLIVEVVWVALGTGDLEAKHTSSSNFFWGEGDPLISVRLVLRDWLIEQICFKTKQLCCIFHDIFISIESRRLLIPYLGESSNFLKISENRQNYEKKSPNIFASAKVGGVPKHTLPPPLYDVVWSKTVEIFWLVLLIIAALLTAVA